MSDMKVTLFFGGESGNSFTARGFYSIPSTSPPIHPVFPSEGVTRSTSDEKQTRRCRHGGNLHYRRPSFSRSKAEVHSVVLIGVCRMIVARSEWPVVLRRALDMRSRPTIYFLAAVG